MVECNITSYATLKSKALKFDLTTNLYNRVPNLLEIYTITLKFCSYLIYLSKNDHFDPFEVELEAGLSLQKMKPISYLILIQAYI